MQVPAHIRQRSLLRMASPRRPRTFSFPPSAIPGVRQRIHGRRPKPAIPVPRSASARMTLPTWNPKPSRETIPSSPSRPALRLAWGDIRFPLKPTGQRTHPKTCPSPPSATTGASGRPTATVRTPTSANVTRLTRRRSAAPAEPPPARRKQPAPAAAANTAKRIPTTTPARRNGRPPRPPTSRNGRAAAKWS